MAPKRDARGGRRQEEAASASDEEEVDPQDLDLSSEEEWEGGSSWVQLSAVLGVHQVVGH